MATLAVGFGTTERAADSAPFVLKSPVFIMKGGPRILIAPFCSARRNQAGSDVAQLLVQSRGALMDRHQPRLAYASEIEIGMDTVLADSFPASDPPSWTWGVARIQRQRDPIGNEPAVGVTDDGLSGTSLSARHRWLKGIVALFQGAGVALLFPLFIVGLPVALAFRLVLELTGWRIVGPRQK